MADQSSSVFLHKKLDKGFNLAIGLSKSLVDDGTQLGISPIPPSEMNNKRRCLDNKCALEVQVIDDTALIGATASVTRFKNRYQKHKTDVGFQKSSRNNEENGGKKKRNKGFKKQQVRCSTKCLNEKKFKGLKDDHVVEDKCESKKQIPEVKFGYKGCRKMSGTVKYVYRKKETEKVENRVQETDVSLKVSDEDEKVSESVDEKDDGVELSPEVDDVIPTESEVENVSESTTVEFKKSVYTRAEMEALRLVDEPGQRAKWAEVYSGFGPLVAKEYNELVAEANNRPAQRYNRVVNCGSSRHANPILATPPVLPLCSLSDRRKFDRVGSRVSFN